MCDVYTMAHEWVAMATDKYEYNETETETIHSI